MNAKITSAQISDAKTYDMNELIEKCETLFKLYERMKELENGLVNNNKTVEWLMLRMDNQDKKIQSLDEHFDTLHDFTKQIICQHITKRKRWWQS